MVPRLLDSVELLVPAGDWPAGTLGAVVLEPAPGFVTVEVSEELVSEDTDSLDALVDVPVSSVRVVARAAQPA